MHVSRNLAVYWTSPGQYFFAENNLISFHPSKVKLDPRKSNQEPTPKFMMKFREQNFVSVISCAKFLKMKFRVTCTTSRIRWIWRTLSAFVSGEINVLEQTFSATRSIEFEIIFKISCRLASVKYRFENSFLRFLWNIPISPVHDERQPWINEDAWWTDFWWEDVIKGWIF